MDVIQTLIETWKPINLMGFKEIMRLAEERKVLDHHEMCLEFGESPSTIRGWVTGSLVPSRPVQAKLVQWVRASLGRQVSPTPEIESPSQEILDPAITEEIVKSKIIEVCGKSVKVELSGKKEGWTALAEGFDFSATGASEIEAVLDLKALLMNHLS